MESALSSSQWLVLICFVVGYLGIIFEHKIGVNKTISALLTAMACWIAQFSGPIPRAEDLEMFSLGVAEAAQIVFFLLGALLIVETIQVHGGLSLVRKLICCQSKKKLLWIVGFLTFFLSSILDNLTTTVVMIMILRKLLEDREDRLIFGGLVVIAANAGGAWTPIGDVTTTMLWVGGKLSTTMMMKSLFFPSMGCLVAALCVFTGLVKGSLDVSKDSAIEVAPGAALTLFLGLGLLIAVPIFRYFTGLPPFMGMLFGMCVLWIVTDFLHKKHNDRNHLRFSGILPRLDTTSLLFFLGILMSVNVLGISGILRYFAQQLDVVFASKQLIAVIIGIISSVVDNVPLVAACMGMYDMTTFPMDAPFWTLIAFTAGTGGSLLIIGSAAGVAFMGLEKVDFFWYVRKALIPALVGYAAGIGIFIIMQAF